MIWIAFAFLTAASVICVLWPMARGARIETRASVASGFYQAQARAIQNDQEAGLISTTDAAIASTEAARRALAAQVPEAAHPVSRPAVWLGAALAVVGIPAFAIALYLHTGSPDLPDMPLAGRVSAQAAASDIGAIVAKMETYLAAHPEDGQAQAMLAPVYMRLGRSEDAAGAYRQALALLGDTPLMRADYAEALVAVANGDITPDATVNFEQSLKLDPTVPKARFYLGIAAERAGETQKAIDIYQKLIAEAPPKASYLALVQRQLGTLQSNIARGKVASPAGATSAAEAIATMPDQERNATIRAMVEGLASRLTQNGRDADGWVRLIRAFKVLHEDGRAGKALADARKSMDGDTDALGRINALAQELGISAP